jgi:hypothetical protein
MSEFLKQAEYQGGSQWLNDVADTTPSAQTDITGLGFNYGGGLNGGDYLRLTDKEALAVSDTVTGTLYGGIYRRVLLKAGIVGGGNTGFKRGQIVFWDIAGNIAGTSLSEYQVTNVEATDPQMIAGIIINANDTATLPLSGLWVWIQVAGLATVLYQATVTDTTQYDSVYWGKSGAGASNATANALAAATAVTTLLQASFIGIAADAPANAGLKRVQLIGLSDRRI